MSNLNPKEKKRTQYWKAVCFTHALRNEGTLELNVLQVHINIYIQV